MVIVFLLMINILNNKGENMLLTDWIENNKPYDDMLWKEAFWDQIHFVNSNLCALLCGGERLDDDALYKEYKTLVRVVSSHTSKSIVCPVYQISWKGFVFIMRYNFFNWKVTVEAPYSLKDIDFEDIFEIDSEISSCYCEGMGENIYSSFLKNPQQFTIELQDKNEMYFFFRKIWYDVRKKEKEVMPISVILKDALSIIPDVIYYSKDTLKKGIQEIINKEEKSKSKIQDWHRINTVLSLGLRYNKEIDKNIKKDIYFKIFDKLPEWLKEEIDG